MNNKIGPIGGTRS